MGLHDVVGAPLDRIKQVAGLSGGAVGVGISDTAPGQHSHGVGKGKAKLDVIAGCKDKRESNSDHKNHDDTRYLTLVVEKR